MSKRVDEVAMAALVARLEELEREVAELRAERATAPPGGEGPLTRRRLLLGAGAAAAGVAGAVLAGAEPAAAGSQGQPMECGLANTATSGTTLTANISSGAFRVSNNTSSAVVGTRIAAPAEPVAAGVAGQSTTSIGVSGISTSNLGVYGRSGGAFVTNPTPAGIVGDSASGAGVIGTRAGSTAAHVLAGVTGESSTGVGTSGSSTANIGVYGRSGTDTGVTLPPAGVVGESSNRIGVVGITGGDANRPAIYGRWGTETGKSTDFIGAGVQGVSVEREGVVGISDQSCGVACETFGELGRALYATASVGLAADVQGADRQLLLRPLFFDRVDPTDDAVDHERGELFCDGSGTIWACVTTGAPGTWRKVSSAQTAGQLHVLPAPVRIYDSRPGTSPSQGPKTKFAANETRVLDCTFNNSTVPLGATAALLTILLVNAATTNGNFTVWANGLAKPAATTMVWGGTATRFTTSATTALDNQARIQVNASAITDLVVDVVGYYR